MNMPANLQEALPFVLLGIALLVALWVLFRASRKTKVIGDTGGDVLDEGAARAGRNQALIDAEPAASQDAGVPLETSPDAPDAPMAMEPAASSSASPSASNQAAKPDASEVDDLKRIKGLGPKLVTILAEQGVTSFAQIAAWSDADVERIDANLGKFSGRIIRDKWVEQAKLLAAGDDTAFSKTFGNNG